MDEPARLLRLGVRVDREHGEVVLAELLELSPGGLEEVDLDDGRVEYALYGPPGELPSLPDLHALAGDAIVEVTCRGVPGDWAERWRAFHQPITVPAPPGSGRPDVHVRPPWERPGPAGAIDVVIDPAQAFGTGAHATTRMCLSLLLELDPADDGPLLDVGCGSGVLAIAAAQLGHRPVIGVDHERESVIAAAENAQVNGVALDVHRADLRLDALPSARIVLANLLRPLLLDLARALPAPPANLIASGLLTGEEDEVAGAFAERLGLHERERRREGEWAALWLSASCPGPGG
ncbi:MAG TPA: 50S ribosomal protein L11 methyltransferase [Solirubrobacteraceae bacterium]|nr:50S ribosomal protein L11 methyltransferase [Solirubrobacteraceae bacterium]